MRKKVIVGNWKMNNSKEDVQNFFTSVGPLLANSVNEFGVCVPSVYLGVVPNSNLGFGAQNMHFENSGAYTGEISASMLNDVGAKYVIIGHSERREYFHETDEIVNLKLKKALEFNLVPIVCCGETLEQYNLKETKAVVEKQLVNGFKDVASIENVIIAYEPIWAIGTGLSASSEEANEMCKFVRSVMRSLYGEAAENVTIQYGGSVNPDNVVAYLSSSDIDGALVGGASLTAEGYLKLINKFI